MYNMLLIGTEVKSSDLVEIKPNQRAWEKQDDVKLEKKDTNISLTPFNSPFRLYYDDLKSLLPRCMILGQVLDSLLIAFSSELFKNGKKVFILPCHFFQVFILTCHQKNLSLAAAVIFVSLLQCLFLNRHWSLILVNVEEEIIYYLDPLFGYVPEEKVQQDILILKKYCGTNGWIMILTPMYHLKFQGGKQSPVIPFQIFLKSLYQNKETVMIVDYFQ